MARQKLDSYSVPEVSLLNVKILFLCARYSLKFIDHTRIAKALQSSQFMVDECIRKLINNSLLQRCAISDTPVYRLSLKGQTTLYDVMSKRPDLFKTIQL